SLLYAVARAFVFSSNAPATSEIYTLSLHDALPICLALETVVGKLIASAARCPLGVMRKPVLVAADSDHAFDPGGDAAFLVSLERSEEHTSELQSRGHLVCRLLLEKKKTRCQQSR